MQRRAYPPAHGRPLLAALLSSVVPGAGQLYLGRSRRGLAMAAAALAVVAGGLLLWRRGRDVLTGVLTRPSWLLVLLAVDAVLLGFRVFCVVDAGHLAAGAPGRARRGVLAGMAGLVLFTAVPHSVAAFYDVQAYDLLTSVFGGNGSAGLEGVHSSHQVAVPGRITVLLLGGDAGLGRTGLRTDTMIVASVEPASGRATLFGLPRNLVRVPLPPGPARQVYGPSFPRPLNELYAFTEFERPDLSPGVRHPGILAVRGAAEELLGIRIDHYALVDLKGFVDVINALGGVTVNVTNPTRVEVDRLQQNGGPAFTLQPGRHHLSGLVALAYARQRKQTSDYDRMRRQRCLLSALAAQTSTADLLRAFPRLVPVLKRSVTTDIPIGRLPAVLGAASGRQARTTTIGFPPPRRPPPAGRRRRPSRPRARTTATGAPCRRPDMVAPVLFLVDDDPSVLDALAADLGRRLAGDYRIVAERSAPAGLAALERLAVRSEEVALVVAARQLAGMDGIDFLVRAHELHPGAKRVLLERRGRWTAGEPIVRALTLGQIDFLLYRPWVPLEQYLYPTVAEFLAAWDRTRDAAAPAVRIVGPRFQARSHELRDTLSRVGIPYAFHASDSERGRELLERVGEDGSRLPVLVFQTGRALVQPSHAELAEALGMRTRPTGGVRDLVVVGAGPAGLAAAVYAASEGLLTLVLEPAVPGGQAGSSSSIRNYLGFPRGVSGEELTQRAFEQAWLFGADFVIAQAATGLETRGRDRVLRLSGGGEVAARAVIVATGVAWRRLAAPGLEELTGAGVFYGAAGAEARAMRGEDVVVVGAGNSAGQAALHLARYAASVTIVAIEDRLVHMSDYLVQGIRATPNVTVRLHTEVVGGQGRGRLRAVALRDRAGGATETLPAAALFVLIGAEPRTEWLGDRVERDEGGYLLAGRDLLRDGRPPAGWPLDRPPLPLETSLPGVFAAGDVRHRSVKRVASAVGAGAIAVQLVHEYLGEASG